VNEDQLKAMLTAPAAGTQGKPTTGAPASQLASGAGQDASGTTTTTPDNPEAPQLRVNGAGPAVIAVGSTYADLGATITGPLADLNLGIHIFVDGIATDPVVIDTSTTGTHTIDYVITGISGLTSTTTRTVIVSAPANDNAASSTPPAANDNSPIVLLSATGTDATSTAQ
jgi:surface protein with Ig-like domain